MSTSYSTIFGWGFSLDEDAMAELVHLFADESDDDAVYEYQNDPMDYIDTYLRNQYPDVKLEISGNLNWDWQGVAMIGVNFVHVWDPWGVPVPKVEEPSVKQMADLLEVAAELGYKGEMGSIFGLFVG